jgi:hypothetical protein
MENPRAIMLMINITIPCDPSLDTKKYKALYEELRTCFKLIVFPDIESPEMSVNFHFATMSPTENKGLILIFLLCSLLIHTGVPARRVFSTLGYSNREFIGALLKAVTVNTNFECCALCTADDRCTGYSIRKLEDPPKRFDCRLASFGATWNKSVGTEVYLEGWDNSKRCKGSYN